MRIHFGNDAEGNGLRVSSMPARQLEELMASLEALAALLLAAQDW